MAAKRNSSKGKKKPADSKFDSSQKELDVEASKLLKAMSKAVTKSEIFAIKNAITAIAEAKKDLRFAKLEENAATCKVHTKRIEENGVTVLKKQKARLEKIGKNITRISKTISVFDRVIKLISGFV